jgi:Pectinacetylesterase
MFNGAPIVAPDNEWTYVPFPDSACGNGSSTGIMVNPGTDKTKLVIFLMGGGACWNALTCAAGTASNIDKDLTEADQRSDLLRDKYLFQRTGNTPVKDANFVFVPYCTADIHSGDNVKDYNIVIGKKTVHHKGRANLLAFLKRIVPTFTQVNRVLFTGASAGGFGALLNYPMVKSAYPNIRVDLLDDSGPPMTPNGGQWDAMKQAWNVQVPAGCTGCDTNITNALPFVSAQLGTGKMGLASFTEDQTIRSFLLYPTASAFTKDLNDVRTKMLPNQKSFFIEGNSHVMMTKSNPPTTAAGVSYYDWVTAFWNDAPTWDHVGP